MNLPTLKELVINDARVHFTHAYNGELWYTTDSGFAFPISSEEARGAIFLRDDKAILFMRWIRKHLAALHAAMKEAGVE